MMERNKGNLVRIPWIDSRGSINREYNATTGQEKESYEKDENRRAQKE